jgi:hypothetical protein
MRGYGDFVKEKFFLNLCWDVSSEVERVAVFDVGVLLIAGFYKIGNL